MHLQAAKRILHPRELGTAISFLVRNTLNHYNPNGLRGHYLQAA